MLHSSYRGSYSLELRIRRWWHIVPARSSHLSARLVRCSPTDRPLGFGVWRQRGRGIEYDSLRGSDYLREVYLLLAYLLHLEFLCVWYIMHSCFLLYLCDSDIYVIVICDMCALYFESFICHITCAMLFCFASVFYSGANELYYLYSCIFHIFWVHHDGLGHISLPNTFVLISKSLYEPSLLKNSSLSYTQDSIVINHQKEEDWKHLGP